MARLRLPGGVVAPGTWTRLAEVAEKLGDGRLHLSSRGGIRLRGIGDAEALPGALAGAAVGGRHDVVASPLSPEARRLAGVLHDALAEVDLPRRTLIGIDGGDGDVLGRHPDLGYSLHDGEAELIVDGRASGLRVEADELAEVLVRVAGGRVPGHLTSSVSAAPAPTTGPPIGWLEQDNGLVSLGAGLRFGMLPGQVARMLDVIGTPVSVTPWASLVIHDLGEGVAEQVVRVLAPLGLIFDERSPWLRVSACVGSPACGHGLSDVRADALQAVSAGQLGEGRVHFIGCGRGCGRPSAAHTEYRATGDGEYEVTEVPGKLER
ncbi:hypothetical protein A605_07270 [Corynebacterium halotolerans YIM 70093 = DSM 44683]|uniref:Nitrite/Sulfite reductase ferredoxin-like domain-containing protein n=1 Tax=Corynebacterium halotolerans YIM 70093 = DSM 44683 TaxID=1121362 RepID=M1P746_9CORY|nr:hypothetical protein A605_07270 [Corynebacterium halotolerans YIM 70093 = DSM 44683]